jgi:hypothetical protein
MDNFDSYYLTNLIRYENYLTDLYSVEEECISGNIIKLFSKAKDSGCSVVISKQQINMNDYELITRLTKLSKLIDNNIILIENIWIEESDSNQTLTKSTVYIFQNLQNKHTEQNST